MAPFFKSQIRLQLAAILVAIFFIGGKSSLTTSKVQIYNKITIGEDLDVHCKDKNHDLGTHTLKEDEMYEFTVTLNLLIPNVLYFCSFHWLDYNFYFDIYKQTRDYGCDPCTWEIYENGPCKDGDCHGWNPPAVAPPDVVLLNRTNISISEFH